jgi:hypothetical protein
VPKDNVFGLTKNDVPKVMLSPTAVRSTQDVTTMS